MSASGRGGFVPASPAWRRVAEPWAAFGGAQFVCCCRPAVSKPSSCSRCGDVALAIFQVQSNSSSAPHQASRQHALADGVHVQHVAVAMVRRL